MKKFHQNHVDRSDEAEKKERKIRKRYSEEGCKCFAPFVKLHWQDCPLVNKPCPIHGNRFSSIGKEENEPIQNVTVSFYPSIKTEKLFQPVKSLLAHCDPETKINFQYYSQKNFTDKENTTDRFIQTNSEDFKRALSNVFVEKTKSFITDKTNKMKKLKQCFYSPCNSIARKSLSQSSVREKSKDISFEAGEHRNALFNNTLEEPFDDVTCDSSFEWVSPRSLDFDNLVKLSNEKKDSDFVTFTKNSKNSVINHKIFEIKHKKGLNDISAVKFPKQSTQFVYSMYNIGAIKHSQHNLKDKKNLTKKVTLSAEHLKEKKKDETSSTSEKSLSSSSGSVYITPFFLMPTGNKDGTNTKMVDRGTSPMTETVEEKDSVTEKRSAISKGTQTTFQSNLQMKSPPNEKPHPKTVSIQTEPITDERHSQGANEVFLRNYEPSEDTLKDKLEDNEVTSDDESNYSKAAEVQTTDNQGYKEPPAADHRDHQLSGNIRDQASQTEPGMLRLTLDKIFEPEADKTQNENSAYVDKGVQTSFSDNPTTSDFSNLVDSQSSKDMVLVRSSDEQKPELNNDNKPKIWYGKSCSDTELFEKKKCKCAKADNTNPHAEVCLCKRSNFRECAEQSSGAPISKNVPQALESHNLPDKHETAPQLQKAVERISKGEQTSLEDEYLPRAFSDLSELKKIILKYFERANFTENKKDVEGASPINERTDQETMTDNVVEENIAVPNAEQEPRKINNAETQTTVHILFDDEVEKDHSGEPKVKFRQTVLLSDKHESKAFFVCDVCNREMSRFCSNASTNTDKHNLHTVREKTTLIDTKYSKIIQVKTYKKAKNTPREPISNSKPASSRIAFVETEKPAKSLKATENQPRDTNFQESYTPLFLTDIGPAYFRKDVLTSGDRKSPVTESRSVKPLRQEWPDSTKTTHSHVKPSPRSVTTQQLPKPYVCNEIAGTSKVTVGLINPEDERSTTVVRTNPAKAQKSNTQPRTDVFPSLPRAEHPGMQNGQWRKDERTPPASSKPNYGKNDKFLYPVSIESSWPIEIEKVWGPTDKADNSTYSTSKQKRGYQKELEPKDIPAGKKIKACSDETKTKNFLLEEPSFSDLLKSKLEEGSEYIWTASSSAPQVSSRNDFINQNKTTKSEEFKRTSHQRRPPLQLIRFDSDTANKLFTVESCHLKPVTLNYDNQPFNNLLECSVCKSLNFIKKNTQNTCYFWPNSNPSYHDVSPEDPSIERSELNQESTLGNPSQWDEEFIQNLDFSDSSLPLEECPEDNTPDEEEEEEGTNEFTESYQESNPIRSTSKSPNQNPNISHFSFQADVSSSSEFLHSRLCKDSERYNIKKHPK